PQLPGYMFSGGRTRPRHRLGLTTLLTTQGATPAGKAWPEVSRILAQCRGQPSSIAEIAALVDRPVQLVMVVLSDLIDTGALAITAPASAPTDPTDTTVLEAIVAGLRHSVAADAAAGA
ncbi:DUF742 domain-containing protein, partial [Streptomyces sp. 4F14]|uniref:DUF742 domain-containing protein n=1 Tax=Streptomyces sp. 4F14 TaxID=3394380 RepID=UPI003A8A507A